MDSDRRAFAKVVDALAPDMPLLMHGSGDVHVPQVDPQSARLLAELTANYVAGLVGAALDAHQILNDGAQRLPPPPVPAGEEGRKTKKNPRRDFWDEPLPSPKIKRRDSEGDAASDEQQWVGAAGVDFFQNKRARTTHVSAPSAISTQCFIFPICHDVGLYGKVLEVQAARRTMEPVLVDRVVMDVLRGEGAMLTTKIGKPDDAEDNNDPAGEDGPEWPGLEHLVPVHMNHPSEDIPQDE